MLPKRIATSPAPRVKKLAVTPPPGERLPYRPNRGSALDVLNAPTAVSVLSVTLSTPRSCRDGRTLLHRTRPTSRSLDALARRGRATRPSLRPSTDRTDRLAAPRRPPSPHTRSGTATPATGAVRAETHPPCTAATSSRSPSPATSSPVRAPRKRRRRPCSPARRGRHHRAGLDDPRPVHGDERTRRTKRHGGLLRCITQLDSRIVRRTDPASNPPTSVDCGPRGNRRHSRHAEQGVHRCRGRN